MHWGVPAALWLLGLFAAAPALRSSKTYNVADRLRDALILGVAIPLVLGLAGLLYPAVCWVLLGVCIAIAAVRGRRFGARRGLARVAPPYVTIAVLLLVAWPQLERPLLDGDSLSYHLPNAAAWVQAHSLWTTTTRYWWYPPASELFASALYAVGGPFAITWSGFGALALLGLRVVAWMRDVSRGSPYFADALAAATISIYPLAIQGGTLQNDVWLAAFWVESLWTIRGNARPASARTLAVTALIKPQGWILAAIAALTSRTRPAVWFAIVGALGVWIAHDAILWRHALLPPAATAPYNHPLTSTIVAHGAGALELLANVMFRTSPFALVALVAALCGPLILAADRRLRWPAFAAVVLFVVLPFGYETAVPQLAGGTSLRFAAPAIAAGALIIGYAVRRASLPATVLLLASTVFGCTQLLGVFWNDGSTHVALAIAAVAAGTAALARALHTRWPYALAFGLAVTLATHLAARHPLDYYNDALTVNGHAPGVYRWIARNHPPAIAGWGLRLGVVNMLSPATHTADLPDSDACVQARRDRALLVAVAQADLSPSVNAARMRTAAGCGRILHRDAIGAVATARRAATAPPSRPR